MFINGKGEVEFPLGSCNQPIDKISTEYKKWNAKNNMVMSRLFISMTTEISQELLLLDTTFLDL